MQFVSPQPIPGIPVRPPLVHPAPGQVIVSYQVIDPETGCCKCDTLTTGGLVALVLLVLFFWPLACIPCCMASCHQQKQVPVYGYPSGPPAMGPPAMAIPVTMYPASGPVPVANV